jgi:hypothetical protein
MLLEVNELNTYSLRRHRLEPVWHRRVAVLINNSALLKKYIFYWNVIDEVLNKKLCTATER